MARTLQDKHQQQSPTAAVARNGAAAPEQPAFAVGQRGAAAAQPAVMAIPVMPGEDAALGIGVPDVALSDDLVPSNGRNGATVAETPVRAVAATSDLARAGSATVRTLQGHIVSRN